MATEVGIIKVIVGTVTATSTDGTVRNLQVGDKVFANDLITTGIAGAVEIEFADGSLMDLGRSSQALLDSEVYDPTAVAENDVQPQDDVAALQQAILEGQDPTEVTEATAAGAGVQNGNEGHDAVFVDYLAPEVTPEAGFDTIGVASAFPILEEEQTILDPNAAAGTTPSEPGTDSSSSTITLTDLSAKEGDGTATLTASVDSPVTGSPLVITLDNGATVTIPVGETSAQSTPFQVQGDDPYVDPESYPVGISGTTGGEFTSLDTSDTATVNITDTIDTTTVTLNDVNVAEDGTITYSASVDNAPETDLTLTLNNGVVITIAAGTTSGSSDPQPAQGEDVYVDGESNTISITSSSGGNYEDLDTSDTATVNITDTIDTTTVTLNDVNVAEDGTITYSASVDNAPETDLTLTLNNGVVITIAAGTTSGSSDPQPAQGEDVYIDADSTPISITSSSGGNYEDLDITDTATVNISDTIDTTTVTLNDVNVAEDGTITYSASVDNAPETDLTLTLNNGVVITIAAGTTSGSSDPQPAQGEDVYVDGESNTISITSSSGGNYEDLDITDTATVNISDTIDTVTATLSTITSEITEEGGSIEYVITLTGGPGDIDPDQDLVFTLANGEQITIAAGDTTGSFTRSYTDAEITNQTSITNSISAIQSGGDEYENLVTAGNTDVDVNYDPVITNNTGVTVDEDDLGDGTDTDKESTTQPGSFTISAPDGVDDLSIDGHAVITDGVFTAISFTTALGNTLTVSAYNSTTGELSYSYTLNNNTLRHGFNDDGENSIYEDLPIVLSDTDGSSVNDTLRAEIIDDAPIAEDDTDTTANGVATGNVITDASAGDAGDTDAGRDAVGADGSRVMSVSFDNNDVAVSLSRQGTTIEGQYGSLTIHYDGSYEYTTTPGTTLTGDEVDEFSYTIIDGDGDTSSATLSIDVVNAVPVASAKGLGLEDSAGINVTLTATDADGTIAHFVMESLPDHGTLYYQGSAVSAGDEIDALNNSAALSFVPDPDWSGDTSFNFHAVDNNAESSASATAPVTVIAVTDTPIIQVDLSDTPLNATTNSINIDNVHAVDQGFTVTAYDINGNQSNVSTVSTNGGKVQGFGVSASAGANGAATELQQVNGVSEKLVISFDEPVTDVSVSFSWLASIESAHYVVKDVHGNVIAEDTVKGVTDTVDAGLQVSGQLIGSIEFTAPGAPNGGSYNDDYLVHQVSYTTGESYPLSISAQATDIDLSEDIISLTVALPEGTILSHGTLIGTENGVSTWSLALESGHGYDYQYDALTDSIDVSGLTVTVPTDYEGVLSVSATVTAQDGSAPVQTATDMDSTHITPASHFLNGSIITNTNSVEQQVRITFTELANPANTFSTVVILNTEGQQEVPFRVDAGFEIHDSSQYLVAVNTLVSDQKVQFTNFTVEGVELDPAAGNIKLGFANTGDGFTQVIQPDTGVVGGDTTVDYSTESTLASAGPTITQVQSGADVPMLDGTTGDDVLTGDDGINVLSGDGGNDTLNGMGGNDILIGGTGNDILSGGAGDDILYGNEGSDTLTGGTGADVFKWNANEDGSSLSPAEDVVTDFSAADHDVLDISDLLSNEESNDITNYLSVQESGNDVVINVTPSGAGDATQTITLQDTTLSDLGADPTGSQADIINSLIDSGHIHVDS